jgi:excisionase family DNA binding protein
MPTTKKPTPPSDPTRQEAAAILNCGLGKVDELVAAGTLQAYKLSPGRRGGRRIVRESLEAFRAGKAA